MNITETQYKTMWNRGYICAFIANALLCFSQNFLNTLVSEYAGILGAGTVMAGVITGLYFGISFAARPFSGPAITKLNKKHIMYFAYGMGVIVNVVYAVSANTGMFIVARILHGIQFAFIGSLNLVLAADYLPKDKMGSGLGFFGVGGAITTAIGPTIGMSLCDWGNATFGGTAGYKIVFLVSAACMLVSILPCALMPYKRESKEELDKLGKWYNNIIAVESIFPAILMLLFSMASIMYTSYMKLFAQERGIENIGYYFTVYAIVLLAARPLCGKLLDKYGIKTIFYPAAVCFVASFLIVGSSHTLWMTFVGAVLAAIGYGAIQPSIQTLCVSCVDPLRRGAASNTNYFGLDLGYFLGPIVGGFVVDISGSYATMYYTAVIPLILGTAIFTLGWGKFKNYLK